MNGIVILEKENEYRVIYSPNIKDVKEEDFKFSIVYLDLESAKKKAFDMEQQILANDICISSEIQIIRK